MICMQFSIRNSLALMGLIALCVAGLVIGPPLTWIGTTALAFLLIAVTAQRLLRAFSRTRIINVRSHYS